MGNVRANSRRLRQTVQAFGARKKLRGILTLINDCIAYPEALTVPGGWVLPSSRLELISDTSRLLFSTSCTKAARLRLHPARHEPEQIREAVQVNDDLRVLKLIGLL